jgi:hypothetical protein
MQIYPDAAPGRGDDIYFLVHEKITRSWTSTTQEIFLDTFVFLIETRVYCSKQFIHEHHKLVTSRFCTCGTQH